MSKNVICVEARTEDAEDTEALGLRANSGEFIRRHDSPIRVPLRVCGTIGVHGRIATNEFVGMIRPYVCPYVCVVRSASTGE